MKNINGEEDGLHFNIHSFCCYKIAFGHLPFAGLEAFAVAVDTAAAVVAVEPLPLNGAAFVVDAFVVAIAFAGVPLYRCY